MRVMFLAGREVGLDQHRVFWAWYTQFIAHFIAVYERTAPPYTQGAAQWSAVEENVTEYKDSGGRMRDLMGNKCS